MSVLPQVLVLAGQRAGVVDPLCSEFGVEYKVETPIANKPMLGWVKEALIGADLAQPFLISGFPKAGEGWVDMGSGDGPADSALIALEKGDMPCLMTTGDHPLLTSEMIKVFIKKSEETRADFCVGLASQQTIEADYPETKRTYLKFSDVSVSGCNLFYIANKKGLEALEFWREAQHLRKQPLKLAKKIGFGLGIKYAAGKLSIGDAFAEAGKKIGITAAPVLLPFSEAAIDVDKVSDHVLVEKILLRRFNSEIS
jgi:hypothetical protein